MPSPCCLSLLLTLLSMLTWRIFPPNSPEHCSCCITGKWMRMVEYACHLQEDMSLTSRIPPIILLMSRALKDRWKQSSSHTAQWLASDRKGRKHWLFAAGRKSHRNMISSMTTQEEDKSIASVIEELKTGLFPPSNHQTLRQLFIVDANNLQMVQAQFGDWWMNDVGRKIAWLVLSSMQQRSVRTGLGWSTKSFGLLVTWSRKNRAPMRLDVNNEWSPVGGWCHWLSMRCM